MVSDVLQLVGLEVSDMLQLVGGFRVLVVDFCSDRQAKGALAKINSSLQRSEMFIAQRRSGKFALRRSAM